MPQNISCYYTKQQIIDRIKTVTRRLGWWNLQPGTVLNVCEKCQGLKKGEKINVLCQIRVVSVRKERLCDISPEDVIREGFPNMSTGEFVTMFMNHMSCRYNTIVNRIEFEYLN